MYKDIIYYELADGKTMDELLAIAKKVYDSWMQHQQGFIKWEIHSNGRGGFTDVVYWNSAEDAKNAEKSMMEMEHAAEWFSCYKEGSIKSENVTLLASF